MRCGDNVKEMEREVLEGGFFHLKEDRVIEVGEWLLLMMELSAFSFLTNFQTFYLPESQYWMKSGLGRMGMVI